MDKTALSYWFPKIEAAGLPVPRTAIMPMPAAAQADIWAAFDGKEGDGSMRLFADDLAKIAAELGSPCFLRTDHTSGKHNWERTCFVADPLKMAAHVYAVAEFSEVASMIGLPWDTWVVREMLPTIPLGICPGYGNMPVCREFRFFVVDGEVRCWHPYWPLESLTDGGAPASLFDALCRMDNEAELSALASAAGKAVGGAWSVDILETKRGWFVTDMAEAHKSFHWEGCANQFRPGDALNCIVDGLVRQRIEAIDRELTSTPAAPEPVTTRERANMLAEKIGCEDLPSVIDELYAAILAAEIAARAEMQEVAAVTARDFDYEDIAEMGDPPSATACSTATGIAAAIRALPVDGGEGGR